MASVITDNLRHHLLELLQSSISNGPSTYYVGLSRADSAAGDQLEPSSFFSQRAARNTLQSVKKLNNSSMVVPIVEWVSGEIYDAYDDKDFDQTNFYVYNPNTREVFVCVQQGMDNAGLVQQSTTAPTSPGNGRTFQTADGYRWRYLYKLSGLAYANFKSSTYMPVKRIESVSFIDEEEEQRALQNFSVSGEILSIAIDSGGTGYTTAPTITIVGNGDSASFTPTIFDGSIIKVEADSNGSGLFLHGSGYDYAQAVVSSGDAVLRPVLGPRDGLAKDPVTTLKSKAVMLQVDFQADENGTLLTENDFSQVVLFQNLKVYGSDSDFAGNTGNALKSWNTNNTILQLFEDEIVVGDQTGSKAKVFHHNLTTGVIHYYQDEETGYGSFNLNEFVIGETSAEVAQIQAFNDPDIDPYSGEILYINKVVTVDRADAQTEDIRIVLQLG